MFRFFVPCAAAVAALALAACNETNGMALGPQTAVAQASPAGLPPGAPCASEIGRYQAVIQEDLATGNLEQKVYDQIQRELARASAACASGRGGEAHSIVAGSKSKHGYRA